MIRLSASKARKAARVRQALSIPDRIAKAVHNTVVANNLSPAKRWEGEGK